VTEYPLMQLARLALPPTTVSERQVVKYEQLPRPKNNVDLSVLDVQAVPLEERKFCTQGVELRSTEKIRVGLYACE
jgi:hypothetical protein